MVITNNNIEMTSWWLQRHNMVITNNNIEMTSQHGDLTTLKWTT